MTNTVPTLPSRLQSDKLLVEEVRDELMIYDTQRNKAFCLNQTAAFVWRHADGKTSAAAIATRMQHELAEPVDEQVVWFALDLLSKDGLLAPEAAMPPTAGVSRRQILQKIGVGAMALPMVTALFVSPSKAHASSRSTPPEDPGTHDHDPHDPHHPHDPQDPHGRFWKWLENLF